jgi:hypothetical protein
MTNNDLVGRALHILKDGLTPAVRDWFPGESHDDVAHLLKLISFRWNEIQEQTDRRARTLAHELIDVRNEWAHQVQFSDDDAFRALDSAERIMRLVGNEASSIQVNELKKLLRRPVPENVAPNLEKEKMRTPRIFKIANPVRKPLSRVIPISTEPLKNLPFSTDKGTNCYESLMNRLAVVTEQVYGSAEVKIGKLARCITPLDFGWVRESRVEHYEDSDGEFLRIVMHIGDTKAQGDEFFRLNPVGIQWPDSIGGYTLKVRPYLKVADAYASALFWICPTKDEIKNTHTRKFFDRFAGRVTRSEWDRFEKEISEYISDWKSKCVVRDGFDLISWDDVLVSSNRSNFLFSSGTNLNVLIPFSECQTLDSQVDSSNFSNQYRQILETVKTIVERRYRNTFS